MSGVADFIAARAVRCPTEKKARFWDRAFGRGGDRGQGAEIGRPRGGTIAHNGISIA